MTYVHFNVTEASEETCIVDSGTVLDNSNAEEFSSLLMDLHSAGKRRIIVNMETLEFLSSAGIGSIVGTVELFREQGGDIALVNVNERIMAVLKVLGLANYITVNVSTEEALARYGA